MTCSRILPVLSALLLFLGQQAFSQALPAPSSPARTDTAVQAPDKIEVAARQYCGGVREFVSTHEPVLVAAQLSSEPRGWQRVTSEVWERAGGRAPAALVWEREGHVVAVKLALTKTALDLKPVEYCFWDNGNLAMLSLRPNRRVNEVSPPGIVVIQGQEQFYSEDGAKKIVDEDEFQGPSPLPDKTYYVSVNATALEYRTVGQLPFADLLHPLL